MSRRSSRARSAWRRVQPSRAIHIIGIGAVEPLRRAGHAAKMLPPTTMQLRACLLGLGDLICLLAPSRVEKTRTGVSHHRFAVDFRRIGERGASGCQGPIEESGTRAPYQARWRCQAVPAASASALPENRRARPRKRVGETRAAPTFVPPFEPLPDAPGGNTQSALPQHGDSSASRFPLLDAFADLEAHMGLTDLGAAFLASAFTRPRPCLVVPDEELESNASPSILAIAPSTILRRSRRACRSRSLSRGDPTLSLDLCRIEVLAPAPSGWLRRCSAPSACRSSRADPCRRRSRARQHADPARAGRGGCGRRTTTPSAPCHGARAATVLTNRAMFVVTFP